MAIGMRALRERVCLLKRKLTDDLVGGFNEKWEMLGTTWACVLPLYTQVSRGMDVQKIRSGSIEILNLGYKVILNYQKNFQQFERIEWQNRILALTTRPEIDRARKFVTFYASELNESEKVDLS